MDKCFYNDLFEIQFKKSKLYDFVLKYNVDYGLINELRLFCEKKLMDPSEAKEKFENEFKKFDFYFKIGTFTNFTAVRSLQVRTSELTPLNSLPPEVKKALEVRIAQMKSKELGPTVLKVQPEPESWSLHIQTISTDLGLATHYAHTELTKSLGILSFVNGGNLFPYSGEYHPCYTSFHNSEIQSTYMNFEMEDEYFLTDTVVNNLNSISNIFRKIKKSDIDKRIIKAFDIYSHVQKNTEPIMKIVFYMTMLENLILNKDDKDYLNWKLADRVAFLIGNKPSSINEIVYPNIKSVYQGMASNNKYVINDLVKQLYKLRSQFVHSSESVDLDKYDKFLLIGFYIVEAVLYEFLKLENKKITKLYDSSEEGSEGLLNLIEIIKYHKNEILL
ncbi:HEPN domain-containing protein [Candidatus Nitrosocosmicus arcticus]|uniref:Uncharacterized protein n=1 Tax=Candidatus Nitrosocosmicus arcticus TaxID=2035267 RepID=A0A557SVU4_9ARCH|nr:HEPN domain-containing protein [Candidatus Nitrosocosmicus arcticus]TVP40713.1 hypothetical protein NARC_60100 [Candidatus Nitrosocosmicus arcticus]